MSTTSRYLEDLSQSHLKDAAPGQIVDLSITKQIRVAVVGPRGQFNVVATGPSNLGSTLCTVYWSGEQNAPIIPSRFQAIQDDGLPEFVFYHQACALKQCMEYYEAWKAIDDEQQRCRALGLPLPRIHNLPADFYAPFVYERRNRWQSGRRNVNAADILDRAKAKVAKVALVGGVPHIDLEDGPWRS